MDICGQNIAELAASYGIPILCLLMFVREVFVSYFVRPKFEATVSEGFKALYGGQKKISDTQSRITDAMDHNTSRIGSDIPRSAKMAKWVTAYRNALSASRAYILRFHNGSAFSTNAPVWKFSLMHESTDPASSSISDMTRDILIANVIHVVSPIFDANDREPWVQRLRCGDGSESVVFRIDTSTVTESPVRGFLLSRGITHFVYTPILDGCGRPIGIFCVDYANPMPKHQEQEHVSKEMTDCAAILSTLMS